MATTDLLQMIRLVLAQEQGPPPEGPGWIGGLMPIILIFMIFYLLIFRPEAKKRKERERKVNAVVKGDTVVTTGGIKGVVKKVEDGEVVVQIDKDKDVRVRFLKAALLEVFPQHQGGAQEPSDDTRKAIQERARS